MQPRCTQHPDHAVPCLPEIYQKPLSWRHLAITEKMLVPKGIRYGGVPLQSSDFTLLTVQCTYNHTTDTVTSDDRKHISVNHIFPSLMCPLPVIWNKSYFYDRIIIGSYHLPSLDNIRDLQLYYKIQQKRTPEYPSGTNTQKSQKMSLRISYSPLVPISYDFEC